MKAVAAGILYFVLVFMMGFVLGAVRELLLVPRGGQFLAVLIEAPLMLGVVVLAARWITARFTDGRHTGELLTIGVTGFALLMTAEVIFSRLLRGWPFGDWLAHFVTPAGALSLCLFLLFAAMPVLVGRVRGAGEPK